MFDVTQHAALVIGVLHLLHLDHLGLLEHLDSVKPLVVLRLDQMNSPEATSAKRSQNLEITQRVLALGDAGFRYRYLVMMLLVVVLGLRLLLRRRLLVVGCLLGRGHRRHRMSLLLLLLEAGGIRAGTGAGGMGHLVAERGVCWVGCGGGGRIVGRAVILGRID